MTLKDKRVKFRESWLKELLDCNKYNKRIKGGYGELTDGSRLGNKFGGLGFQRV